MADLGSIGKGLISLSPSRQVSTPSGNGARRIMSALAPGRQFSPAGAKVTVSGTVRVLGVATGGLIVRAYSKKTGDMLGQAVSAGDGTYSIECGGSTNVYVVGFDPTTYQMLGYDEVTPG